MSLVQGILQIVAVTALNLRTLTGRLGSSMVAIVGMAGVVGVLVAVLSMAEGFRATMANTGAADTAIVMRAGSDSEMTSILMREDITVVEDAPQIARGPEGRLVSAELFVIVDLLKASTGTTANAPLRGVAPVAFQVRNIRLVEGRLFEPGRNEIVVGRSAASQYAGLTPGSRLKLGQNEWTVVGMFDAGGTVPDSELWCDANVLGPLYRRGSSRQAVYAKLTSPEAFTAFKDTLTADPRAKLKVMREREYYESQSRFVVTLITVLGSIIAGLMGIGAVFAALNTMYSAVASRTREIATLRALGFRAIPVMVSVLIESMLLALVGGALGALIAYVGFNGYQAATMNWQSMSTVGFAFRVTPELLVRGLAYALLLGLLGGLLPAIRAARLPVVTALREL
jgi:putative ABC transport system permease protein